MFTPKTSTLYEMELNDHAGYDSLDALATRVYGQTYKGQQTGDMLPNDSYHVFDMDEERVEELMDNMKEKRMFLGLKPVAKGTGDRGGNFRATYAMGVNWFEYWLSLKYDPATPYGASSPREWEDARDFTLKYDFQVYREAPTIDYVLADLITRGELPHGRYMIHCSW